jgi:serine/threonine protein kinase
MAPEPTLPLGSKLGTYVLNQLVAVGGMAEIYLASTQGVAGFQKQLVLKVIHPDFAGDPRFTEMLVAEAKLSVELNHPNIIQTFDLGQIEGITFISMEHVDGADFFKILTKLADLGQMIPVEAALFVVRDTLRGLSYAHQKHDAKGKPLRIVHRDVSPQNILVSRQGEVKLVDFGIAKAANATTKTRAGVIKGKLVYMSPEQAWGDTVDARTDVYSAGVVLYEALTGGSLYAEENPARLLERVRRAEIPQPSSVRSEIRPELDQIVMTALRPRVIDRYQSAAEFGAALGEYLHQLSPSFTAAELGALVESVLEGTTPRAPPDLVMRRDDFAVRRHSMIHSAEEMLPSDIDKLDLEQTKDAPASSPTPRMSPEEGLLLVLGSGEPQEYVLGNEFIIGRNGDLRLADGRVSRQHARIYYADNAYHIEDLKSANGTYLNEQKIAGVQLLQPNDAVRIGPFEMRFASRRGKQPGLAPPRLHPTDDDTYKASASLAGNSVRATDQEPSSETGRPQPANNEIEATVGTMQAATLSFSWGSEQLTLEVTARLALSAWLAIGDVDLEGSGGAVVKRSTGYWLEPGRDSGQIRINGRAVTGPTQLAAGDLLAVGPVQFEFRLD